MFKKMLLLAVAVLASACSFAGSASGYLYRVPQLGYFDFFYPTNLSRSYMDLQMGDTLKLQSRFMWGGAPGRTISPPQHAIVAFTNRGATNNMVNTSGQMFWTHGAGAIVSERGLELELWFRNDANGNGFNDDTPNAYVWSQAHNRCVRDVQGTITTDVLCLGSDPSAGSYITSAPSFALKSGVYYWLRVKLIPFIGTGWATLYADLIEETPNGAVLVQSAAVGFEIARFFPMNWQAMEATVARTPGTLDEPFIEWIAFDYGF